MERFRYSEEEQALIEESCIPYAVYQFVDHRVVTIAFSQGFVDLFGAGDRAAVLEVLDTNMYRDTHPDDVAAVSDASLRFATKDSIYDVAYRTKIGGEYHVIHARGRHVTAKTGERLAYVWYADEGVFDPLSGPGQAVISFASASNLKGSFDHMTGLPGMNYFFEIADAARKTYKEHGNSPATVFFDFTGMRNYNVQYGFAEGDKLITGMAQVLARQFSSQSCCRLGGDRFAVFTIEEGLEDRLRAVFAEGKLINNGNSLPIRAGIYPDRMGEVRIGVACDRAKMACDIPKGNTESCFNYFNEELLKAVEKRQYIIEHLDEAMEKEWIRVYYQPIVRAANGCVCDEEALARWIDPNIGFLSPADFIPVLEEEGLIYKLDLYITDQVLKKMRLLADRGLYMVPCSLNISRSDFESCDIVEEIRKRVDDSGIDRSMITIEITESIIGGDIAYIQRQVERMHDLGFEVWMDDYGSGYSSPDILLTIPFDTIKLDMLFIRQFETNPSSRIIISSLVKMALSLGIDTVVEGVETAEQAEFLKEIGATKLQGYHFCKPIPVEEILRRYDEGRQIGFENPDEAKYYSAIGRVNLYDISLTAADSERLQDYFNTMPMAIVELDHTRMVITRTNQTYRSVIENHFLIPATSTEHKVADLLRGPASEMMKALLRCTTDSNQLLTDIKTRSGKAIHLLIRHISMNPVTGAHALLVVVLAISNDISDNTISYAHVAQALSAEYVELYYVNLDDDSFVAYRPGPDKEKIAVTRKGSDFTGQVREYASEYIYPEDRPKFMSNLTKENVIRDIERVGAFSLSYRRMEGDVPVYVAMKANYIGEGKNKIVIGVSNIDAQVRQRAMLERLKEEKTTYSRIMALTGDYVCFYTVDPKTGNYYEYSASEEFAAVGASKSGEDFFTDSHRDIKTAIHPDDYERLINDFTMENVLRSIAGTGRYSIRYRLMLGGKPVAVHLKAAMVREDGEDRIIIGVNKDR